MNGTLAADPFEEQIPAAALARLRLPPPVRIDGPAPKQATFAVGSLRSRLALLADEGRLDLAEPLSSEQAMELAVELDSDPAAVRRAVTAIREGRGVRAFSGGSKPGRKVRPKGAAAQDTARALALEVVAALLESGEAEDVRRAAGLVERLLD